tara:strand:- start:57 stop:347 length:291 start_codon:yes stop_codon:yes gene_type:complete
MIPEFRTGDLVSYFDSYSHLAIPFLAGKEHNVDEEIEETALILGFLDGDDGSGLSDNYSTHDCVVYARILGPLGEKTVLLTELTILSSAGTIREQR